MGGKNVVMVMDDANLELAVEGCVWGGFGTTGPALHRRSRVVVHEKVYQRFLDAFVARTRTLRVGDGLDPATDVGPSVSDGQRETVMNYVAIGLDEGATLACGGRALTSGVHARGYFHEPTIFSDVAPSMRIAQEEIFGPVVSVIPCRSFDEAIAIGNGVDYGCRRRSTRRTSTARSPPCATCTPASSTSTRRPSAPKCTCRSAAPSTPATATAKPGTAALDVFSEWKSIYVDFSGKLQRAQIDVADL
jgi:aldehyde dehydrogenase (NAD+)